MNPQRRATTYLQRQPYVGSSSCFLNIFTHPIAIILPRFRWLGWARRYSIGAIAEVDGLPRALRSMASRGWCLSYEAKPQRVGNICRLLGTKEEVRLMHVLAFDELSRFTTALFSAPFIFVSTRPFAHLLNRKRRIVDTLAVSARVA